MIFRLSHRLLNSHWSQRSVAKSCRFVHSPVRSEPLRFFPSSRDMIFLVAVLLGFVAVPNAAEASEPLDEFLRGLRGRGYYDMAFEYLEQMKTSRLISTETREKIPYEEAVTYLESSRHQRDPGLRAQHLDTAQEKLRKFLKSSSHPDLDITARNQLGNILAERARLNMLEADDAESPDEAKKLRLTARGQFDDAYDVYRELEAGFREKLKDLPKHVDKRSNPKLYAEVTKCRQDFLQTLLVSATVVYEKAATAEAESEDRKKWLEEAVGAFDDISQKYRNWLAGFYALLYQARCLQDLGKIQDALGMYTELIDEEIDSPVYRKLKTKAYASAISCWASEPQNNFEEAILRGSTWFATMRPNEQRNQDWLAFRLEFARAYKTQADAVKAETPNAPLIQKNYSEAVSHARHVARSPGPLKEAAREFLEAMGEQGTAMTRTAETKTFDEARAAGWEWLQQAQKSTRLVSLLADRMTRVDEETAQRDLEKQKKEAAGQIEQSNEEALESYRRALSLAEPSTPIEDLNGVRYYLSFLLYQAGDFYDAAVLSEFVTRHYPESAVARQCAKIALACYVSLRQAALQQGDEQPAFELAHILAVAEYIVDKWPKQKESQEALSTLINLSIQQGDMEGAERYLAKIDASSTARALAELQTGQALWRTYLANSKQLRRQQQSDNPPTEQQIAETQKQLESLKDRVQSVLESGVNRLKSEEMSAARAAATLSLAQLYLDIQKTEKARELLEEEGVGCLALVAANHPAARGRGFAEETYKTALRTYISALADVDSADASDALMKNAEQMMAALEKTVGDSAAGRKRLVGIYIGLASDLEQQIELAPAAARESVSTGFEIFLRRVVKDSADIKILNWAAEMFFRLGQSNDSGRGQVAGDAQRFYASAVSTYKKILEHDESQADPSLMIHMRLRMAKILRRTGEFEGAVNLLDEILRERNAMLNVQVEAAQTFQEWAVARDADRYLDAINGVAMDGNPRQKVIWGWATLARRTDQKPKFVDTFYQSRYNLAHCRYRYALAQQGNSRRQTLKLAQRDIAWTASLYPEMGGAQWKAKFDDLLKQVRQALGKTAA